MSSRKNYWPGFLPAYILLFFFLSYMASASIINTIVPSLYLTIFLFGIILLLLIVNSVKNKAILQESLSSLSGIYIYFVLLTIVLVLASFQANNIFYSLAEALITVFLQALLFIVFYIILSSYIRKNNWINYFEVSALVFIFIIFIGQLIIPEWRNNEWGFRLSGGTNPNTIAFVVMFILLQTHLNALLLNNWSLIRKVLWLTSLGAIIWTLSRTTFLTLGILYTLYFGYILCNSFYYKINKGISLNSLFKRVIQGLFALILTVTGLNIVSNTDYYQFFEERLFNLSSVESRFGYTELMMSYFRENIVFGGVGWREIDKILPSNDDLASSSHNLFARVLSETGVLGLTVVLLLPAGLTILLLKNSQVLKKFFHNPIAIYLAASIIAIFLGQFFEDRYMRYTFSIHNNIIVWLLSFSLIIYFQAKSFKMNIK